MASVREKPWHGLGVVLDEYPKSIEEAIRLSGLGWQVRQGTVLVSEGDGDPLMTLRVADEIARAYETDGQVAPAQLEQLLAVTRGNLGLKLAEGFRANVREDTGDVLGIVTDDYRVVQNETAFKFLDAVIASDAHYETMGSLMSGRRVWVMVRLPEFIEVAGDQVGTYLYVANSHDGSMAVTSAVTPIRVVCNNTLSWALSQAEKSDRTYRFRHVGSEESLDSKFAEARKVLGLAVNYEKRFKKLGDELGTKRMAPPQFRKDVVIPLIEIDRDKLGKRAIQNREESRELLMNLFLGRVPGNEATVGNAPMTAWCAANAVCEWADWFGRYTTKTDQMQRSMEARVDIKQRGLELVREAVGV
jgi:phage/plasmid-like protein (TIGR03299 family)